MAPNRDLTAATAIDWWHLEGVSGPCCHWTNGCRQEPPEALASVANAPKTTQPGDNTHG